MRNQEDISLGLLILPIFVILVIVATIFFTVSGEDNNNQGNDYNIDDSKISNNKQIPKKSDANTVHNNLDVTKDEMGNSDFFYNQT
jgi:hypothetical protein